MPAAKNYLDGQLEDEMGRVCGVHRKTRNES
jgi:hypothetical protein